MNTLNITLAFNPSGRYNYRDKLRVGIAHHTQVASKNHSYTSGSSEPGFVAHHSFYNSNADDPCKPRISNQSDCPVP